MEIVNFRPVEEVRELANKVFAEQKELILEKIPFAEVHHIGSTAIPGSITKGDLDINVRVKREKFAVAVDILKKMYEINQPENWNDNFASFKTDKLEIDFGLQLTVIGSEDDIYVKNKDILLGNPALVEKLNILKREYEGKTMGEYRKHKAEFFRKLLKESS